MLLPLLSKLPGQGASLHCRGRTSPAKCKSQLPATASNCQQLPGRMLCSYNWYRGLN
eukprot:CAMPEP_0180746630 /NCGR_PEP_ID=MMETSP1038_2-20121128/29120_1 /TAXON_ID=632150 /ORGANISM="Azadinium spinosum, Strain 3D9" /LENGTH=56 /DNA_ID=CAMNT_0022780199 /DNA_START=62 /DNA_END=229 /DNA_ORIENTATION=+